MPADAARTQSQPHATRVEAHPFSGDPPHLELVHTAPPRAERERSIERPLRTPTTVVEEAGLPAILLCGSGVVGMAWSDEVAIEAWLAHAGESEAVQRRNLSLIRERGFQVALRSPGTTRHAPEIGDMARGREAPRYREHMVGLLSGLGEIPIPEAILPDERYEVVLVAAPLFDRAGACAFNLCLNDFPAPLSGSDILACAERLLAACLKIMQTDRA